MTESPDTSPAVAFSEPPTEPAAPPAPLSPPARAALALVGAYKRFVSPLFPATCRYVPTCSEYAMIAIQRYGFLRGSWMAIKRICRCHPFHPGGYDPVP